MDARTNNPGSLAKTVIAALGVFDPDQASSATEAAVRALLRQGKSANTQASYGAAMRYWSAWYYCRYGQEPAAGRFNPRGAAVHALRERDEPARAPVDTYYRAGDVLETQAGRMMDD